MREHSHSKLHFYAYRQKVLSVDKLVHTGLALRASKDVDSKSQNARKVSARSATVINEHVKALFSLSKRMYILLWL